MDSLPEVGDVVRWLELVPGLSPGPFLVTKIEHNKSDFHRYGTFLVVNLDGSPFLDRNDQTYRCAPEEVYRDEFMTAARRAKHAS